jgi:hypothetical protein
VISILLDAVRFGNDVKRKWDALSEEQQAQIRAEFDDFQEHLKDASGAVAREGKDAADWAGDRVRGAIDRAQKALKDRQRAEAQRELAATEAQVAALRAVAAAPPDLEPAPVAVVLSAILARGGDIEETDLAATVSSLDGAACTAGLERAIAIGIVQRVKGKRGSRRVVVVGLATTPTQSIAIVRDLVAQTGRAQLADVARHAGLHTIALRGSVSALIRAGEIVWFGGAEVWLTERVLQERLKSAEASAAIARAQLEAAAAHELEAPAPVDPEAQATVDRGLREKADGLKNSTLRLQKAISRVNVPEPPSAPSHAPDPSYASGPTYAPGPSYTADRPDTRRTPGPSVDDLDRIRQLHDMYKAGILTEEQYRQLVDKITAG